MAADVGGVRRGAGDVAVAFDHANTRRVLDDVCRAQALSAVGARLLRLGENAIYQLRDEPIVVRIARYADACAKEVAVARWLADCDYPAARIIEALPQLLDVSGLTVTWWHLIEPHHEAPHFDDLARMLRDLHRLPSSGRQTPALPPFDPMPNVARRLGAVTGGTADEVEYLRRRHAMLGEQYGSLTFELPRGPIHGDAHIGNLMRDQSGTVQLIDFEAFAVGPREWDVSVVGAAFRGFGWMTSVEYNACVSEYGWDVTAWDGFSTLRAIRELNMTSWLIQRQGESAEVDAEIRKRIADLRDDKSPRHWRPF